MAPNSFGVFVKLKGDILWLLSNLGLQCFGDSKKEKSHAQSGGVPALPKKTQDCGRKGKIPCQILNKSGKTAHLFTFRGWEKDLWWRIQGYPLSPFCVNLWWHQPPQSFLSSMCLFWQIIPRGTPDFRQSRVISFITEESCSGKAEINHTDTGCRFLSQHSSFQPEAPDGNFGHGAHPIALSRSVEHPRYAVWGRAPATSEMDPSGKRHEIHDQLSSYMRGDETESQSSWHLL